MKKLLVLLVLAFAAAFPAAAYAQQPDPGTGATAEFQVFAPEVLDRAQQALNAQEFDQAVLNYSLFILLNPTHSGAYYERAHSYIGLNDLDHALADATRAIETSSARSPLYDAALYQLRGDIETAQSQPEAALTDYNQSLELQETPEALISRGLLYAAQNDFTLALADIDSAIEIDATNPSLYLYRGGVNTDKEDFKAAGTDYLNFFDLIRTESVDGEEIQTGQGVILRVDRGITFNVPFRANAGQYVSAVAVGETTSIDPLIVLVDGEGNALAGDDDRGGDYNALLYNVPIAEDGQYSLIVGHSLGGFTGNVRVLLEVSDQPMQ